jgi:hypothetical protein
MIIQDVINKFNTTPFLFVGSGITRRYLDLPDWKGLLEHFAFEVKDDPFIYSYYENRAKGLNCPEGLMPKIAELIQRDYDEKWFENKLCRTDDPDLLAQIQAGLSPFKAEVAAYIKRNSTMNAVYQDEIEKLSEISEKSISGVITTNYDSFLEDHFQGFQKYVGQNQLIFSAIQGVAEIYKIHGSVESPETIVINEADYQEFSSKSAYLAAKLLTIFMEYPIIFLGYSVSDNNIQNILKSIVDCLSADQLEKLRERFIFVEYNRGQEQAEITPFTIMIGSKPLTMTKITLSDFLPLYSALGTKKAKLPVRVLRRFKQEVYSYVITSTPTATLRVASIDDNRVSDDNLVLAIGRADQLGLRGLSGITGNDWYRNVILSDLPFSADELLECAFPVLIKQQSNRLPVNKYLSEATKDFPDCIELSRKLTLDKIIPSSIRKKQQNGTPHHSIKEIWEKENYTIEKRVRLISQLPYEKIDGLELEEILLSLFARDRDILEHLPSTDRSHIRRLILIYDHLKWGNKEKELLD